MKKNSFSDLVRRVVEDWKFQTKDMTDEYLDEDRSRWMKIYGRDNSERGETLVDVMESDLHTITIELEQIRRYGKIIYDDKEKLKIGMIWESEDEFEKDARELRQIIARVQKQIEKEKRDDERKRKG
jgi:hypothetical protein